MAVGDIFELEGLQYCVLSDVLDFIGSVKIISVLDAANVITLTIPEEVTIDTQSYEVVEIGERAFYSCTKLEKIDIPSTITTIGQEAFANCVQLTSIAIPNNVTNIGNYAFSDCLRLTSVTISGSRTNINQGAFSRCDNLTSVTIGNGVISIGREAFFDCTSLTSITIPDSVTSIGDYAFANCISLTSATVGNGVVETGSDIFRRCPIESFTGPARDYGLSKDALTTLIFTSGEIMSEYYGYCSNLTEVIFYEGFTEIGQNAFEFCEKLEQVSIPNSVETIGDSAFYGCSSLDNIIFGNGLKTIGSCAFYDCSAFTEINIVNNISEIQSFAFKGCGELKKVTIGRGLTALREEAFAECNITNLFITDLKKWCEVSIQGAYANPIRCCTNCYIEGQQITKLVTPKEITKIKSNTFYGLKTLQEIVVSDCVTEIGVSAFTSCSNVNKITIGKNVMAIGEGAFQSCNQLEKVYYNAICADKSNFVITPFGTYSNSKEFEVVVGKNVQLIPRYLFSTTNSRVRSLTFENGSVCNKIGDNAFENNNITTLKLPNTLTHIGFEAFADNQIETLELSNILIKLEGSTFKNNKIKTLKLPNTLVDLRNSDFENCPIEEVEMPLALINYIPKEALKTISITNGNNIASNTFEAYPLLQQVTLPDSIRVIENQAFYNCPELSEIYFGKGTKLIDKGAFAGCNKLVYTEAPYAYVGNTENKYEVLIGLNNKDLAYYSINKETLHIASEAFVGTTNLKGILILPSLISIGTAVFKNRTGLAEVIIPYTVSIIGDEAFSGCSNLTSIKIYGNPVIGTDAFSNCPAIIYNICKEDFVGFSYNGVHSSELGIIRTSNNNRYTEILSPSFRDVTQPAHGHDGMYLISSTKGPREFTVDIAFDNLNKEKLHKLTLLFDGLGTHELIFDEYPYKAYDAKVKSPPSIKFVPFDGPDGTIIYKGEGSINFISYYPYAHTPLETKTINGIEMDGKYLEYYIDCNNINQWKNVSGIKKYSETFMGYNPGDMPAPFKYSQQQVTPTEQTTTLSTGAHKYSILPRNIYILEECTNLLWDSKTGLITGKPKNEINVRSIKYEGKAITAIGINTGSTAPSSSDASSSGSYAYSYWYY